ncbi:MAG: AAA family ATPase [Butyrivibrio sp.]|nr:AAA family ATPase [Butyrivibrio sp.]
MLNTVLENFHLEKFFWVLKAKLKYMVFAGLIMAVLAGILGFGMTSEVYRARVSFYVYTSPDYVNSSGVNLSSSEIASANKLITSYIEILNSRSFLQSLLDYLDLEGYSITDLSSEISTSVVSNTAIFYVYVYDANPVNAYNIANAIADLAPDKVTSIVKSGGMSVLDEAVMPTSPASSLSLSFLVVAGFAVGFFLMALYSLIKALFDTTVRREYEIKGLFNIPIIGEVPDMTKKDKDAVQEKLLLTQSSPFIVKEAYSDIRSTMLFDKDAQGCPVYVFTSADVGEGKSTSALNLSISLAQIGKKVLLVDSDFRNSKLAERTGLKDENGLAGFLLGKTETVKVCNYIENCDVLLAGMSTEDAANLTVGKKFYALVEKYKPDYDYIFIDMPSLGIYSDSLAMVHEATGYIIVVRERLTKYERTKMVVRKLESLNANISGIIYNCISTDSPDYNYRNLVKKNEKEEAKSKKSGIQEKIKVKKA